MQEWIEMVTSHLLSSTELTSSIDGLGQTPPQKGYIQLIVSLTDKPEKWQYCTYS